MKILVPILRLLFNFSTLFVFISLALLIFLFNIGMSSGFKRARRYRASILSALAHGWARGWLFWSLSLIFFLPASFLLMFLSGADTGVDADIQILVLILGSFAILIFMPGIKMAQQIRARYPTIKPKKIRKIAAIWSLIFPLFLLSIGVIAYFLWIPWGRTTRWRSLWWFATLALILSLNIRIGRGVGEDLTAGLLEGEIESPPLRSDRDIPRSWHKKEMGNENENISLIEYIPSSWLVWLKASFSSRTKIAWGFVWLLAAFLGIARFEFPREASLPTTLGYTASYALFLALGVSGISALFALLLIQNSAMSRQQMLEIAETRFLAGIRAWFFGLIAAFVVFFIYNSSQSYISDRIVDGLSEASRSTLSSEGFWYAAAIFSLLAVYFFPIKDREEENKTAPVAIKPTLYSFMGWSLVWIFLTGVIASRFIIYGSYSIPTFVWIVIRFYLLTALTVSIVSGISAALLMRESSTSWRETTKFSLHWISKGLHNWGIGAPVGWIILIVGLLFSAKITQQGLINVRLKDWGGISLIISGIVALVEGVILFQKER